MGDKWFSKCPKRGTVTEVEFHRGGMRIPELACHGVCPKCKADFWNSSVWKE